MRHSKSRDHSLAATTSPRSWPVRNLREVHSFLINSVLFLLVSPYPFSHSTERNERGVRSHGTRSSSLHVLSLSVSLSLSLARSLFFHPSRVARGCLRAVFLALVFSFALPLFLFLSLPLVQGRTSFSRAKTRTASRFTSVSSRASTDPSHTPRRRRLTVQLSRTSRRSSRRGQRGERTVAVTEFKSALLAHT